MLVHCPPASSGNVGERVKRLPKVYVRESGLVHASLNQGSLNWVASHPVKGTSCIGSAVVQLINDAYRPNKISADQQWCRGGHAPWVSRGQTLVVEITRSPAPTVSKDSSSAVTDLGTVLILWVSPAELPYPMKDGIEVMVPLRMPYRSRAKLDTCGSAWCICYC